MVCVAPDSYIHSKKESFFCVSVSYRESTGLFVKSIVDVYNFSRSASVTSDKVLDVNLVGWIPKPGTDPTKAVVGFPFFPLTLLNLFSGLNSWIVDGGSFDDLDTVKVSGTDMEWALISGGPPDTDGNEGRCYSPTGLWILSRVADPDQTVIDKIDTRAVELGLDVSQYRPVTHEGCTYLDDPKLQKHDKDKRQLARE